MVQTGNCSAKVKNAWYISQAGLSVFGWFRERKNYKAYVKQDDLHIVSLPTFIAMNEVLNSVGNSEAMKGLTCAADTMVPSDRRQPVLVDASVDMLVRHHRVL